MNILIESHEGGIYLVKTLSKFSLTDATDHNDSNRAEKAQHDILSAGVYLTENTEFHSKPKIFKSLNSIKETFEELEGEEVWLYQRTPYEEMIGLSSPPQASLIRMAW